MMSSSGFNGSVSQNGSPLLSNGGQSQCAMHESSGLSNDGGCVRSGSVDNYSSKMSGSASDCSVVAAAAAAHELCGKRDDYENQNHKNSIGGGGNSMYPNNYPTRHMTPFGSGVANGEMNGTASSGNSSRSGGGKGSRSRMEMGIPDDSKLLANPKGIIKSFLPQAAAVDSLKFDAYRELCLAHADEYYKSQKGGAPWANCHVCNTNHPHWNTLQRHLQTHIDFRPFGCDTCGRTFYSQSKLKRHQQIHLRPPSEKPPRKTTPRQKKPKVPKSENATAQFKTAAEGSDETLAIPGEKPFKCPMCERRLGRTEHLKRHLLVHSDDKPYGCSACTHTTKRLDGIRRHLKRKHPGVETAEIVLLSAPGEGPTMGDLGQVMSTIEESEQQLTQKPKKKKKKKKKTPSLDNDQNMQQQDDNMNPMSAKDYAGNLLEVAARFGLSDLRLPGGGVSASESERGFGGSVSGGSAAPTVNPPKEGKNSYHDGGTGSGGGGHSRRGGGDGGGRGGAENLSMDEMKPSWDGGLLLGGLPTQQMHLLYHSLARSHPAPAHGESGGGSMGGGNPAPCNLSSVNNDTSGSSNNLRQPPFCHDRAPMTSPADHSFIMNSSSMPMRYLPTVGAPGVVDSGSSRHVNPMLFSPRNTTRNLGHFGGSDMNMPAEAMISQYIQSQQRFAPPVWGFANPNYHNY